MALNNLRIIYQNIADVSTILASSTGGPAVSVDNLKKDTKGLVYRSAVSASATVKTNLVLNFSPKTFLKGVGVVLCVTNLSSSAVLRVRGYTGTSPATGSGTDPVAVEGGSLQFDTGVQLAAPYRDVGINNWDGDSYYITNSTSTRFRDRKVYARVWLPLATAKTCTSLLIEIIDNNINQFIEISRLLVGDYWSPKFNTSYGLSSGVKDTSINTRSEAGDLVTSSGPKYSTLSFDLKWLTKEDRSVLNKIVRILGTSKPMFVSLFPDNSDDWDKEQMYQIYGKISDLSVIDHSIFEMYGSQLELEEV